MPEHHRGRVTGAEVAAAAWQASSSPNRKFGLHQPRGGNCHRESWGLTGWIYALLSSSQCRPSWKKLKSLIWGVFSFLAVAVGRWCLIYAPDKLKKCCEICPYSKFQPVMTPLHLYNMVQQAACSHLFFPDMSVHHSIKCPGTLQQPQFSFQISLTNPWTFLKQS